MRAKCVIEIWQQGGPSSLESFDPKPDAGKDYNGGLKAIPASVKGMMLHEWLPQLAKRADLFSVVRTLTHGSNGHEVATYRMQTGMDPGGGVTYPAIGAVIAKGKTESGAYSGDLPPSVILTQAKGRFSEIGFLGEKWAPLVTGGNPNAGTFEVDGITPPRGFDRRAFDVLAHYERGSSQMFRKCGEEARRLLEGPAAKAFDLNAEPKTVREKYGRTNFGQCCLAARRLVEYGVPYITLNTTGWDSHKRHFETMARRTAEMDRGVAALLEELADRKLLDTTLVWMTGEFGRRPKIDWEAPWNGGRNHWGHCFSALVAGGGFRGGCVVGESDARAERVKTRPVTHRDLLGSIYELAGVKPLFDSPEETRLREIYA